MWSRSDLKNFAKTRVRANYWIMVLVAIVMMFAVGGKSPLTYKKTITLSDQKGYISSSSVMPSNIIHQIENIFDGLENHEIILNPRISVLALPIAILALVFVLIAMAVVICLDIFIRNPLQIGCARFFMENHYSDAKINCIGCSFKANYKKCVWTMFLRGLYIFLWSLLFIIPGIIKAYEYRMIPYILADNPDISTEDAFEMSKRLMDGNKFKTFVLDLSFIGWEILNVLTLGILDIFYVNPFRYQTEAELYIALKTIYNYTQSNAYNSYYEV